MFTAHIVGSQKSRSEQEHGVFQREPRDPCDGFDPCTTEPVPTRVLIGGAFSPEQLRDGADGMLIKTCQLCLLRCQIFIGYQLTLIMEANKGSCGSQ